MNQKAQILEKSISKSRKGYLKVKFLGILINDFHYSISLSVSPTFSDDGLCTLKLESCKLEIFAIKDTSQDLRLIGDLHQSHKYD